MLLYKDKNTNMIYEIKRIIAYRHELDVISAGMTCELVVEGGLCNFVEDSILYELNY